MQISINVPEITCERCGEVSPIVPTALRPARTGWQTVSSKRPDGWVSLPGAEADLSRGLCPSCFEAYSSKFADFMTLPPPPPEPGPDVVTPEHLPEPQQAAMRANAREVKLRIEREASALRELDERKKRQELARPQNSNKVTLQAPVTKHVTPMMHSSLKATAATGIRHTYTATTQPVKNASGIPIEVEVPPPAPQPLAPIIGTQLQRTATLPVAKIAGSSPITPVSRASRETNIPLLAPEINPLTAAQPMPPLSCEPARIDSIVVPPKRR